MATSLRPGAFGPWTCILLLSAAIGVEGISAFQLLGVSEDSKDLEDVARTCDVETVQLANTHQLHPILADLVNTTFFRLFRVNLKHPSCPFWPSPEPEKEKKEKEKESDAGTCTGTVPTIGGGIFGGGGFGGKPSITSIFTKQSSLEPPKPACSVDTEEDTSSGSPFGAKPSTSRKTTTAAAQDENDKLDRSMTVAEQVASKGRENDTASCEFEEDLPTYWVDMCSRETAENINLEDVNLIKNPERNTGYNGSHIWEAMYKENCFEVGSALPRGRYGSDSNMCYEERVLYRLLSGWHASTTISIVKNYYAPGTKQKGEWAPNPERFMEVLGKHPHRTKNLHFAFVVMLRAVRRAAPLLQNYRYSTGDEPEDNITKRLMSRLLDSQLLSMCSPLFEAFDETRLFGNTSSEQRSLLKRQFKAVFRNITVLVDCVKCQRCRLHAKLFSFGLGSALKILLSPPELIASTTSRDEVVALVNVLYKLSESMEDARVLAQMYWEQHALNIQAELAGKTKQQAQQAAQQLAESRAENVAAREQRTRDVLAEKARSELAAADVPMADRTQLLDAALGAVRQAASSGSLNVSAEMQVLRSLVVRPASDAMLLLAKHYALDRPSLFAALALEASGNTAAAAVVLPEGLVRSVRIGEAGAAVDAVIVGGGLAGMAAAISLLDRGATVVLVDKQPYLGGNSGKASSGINAALETSVESLVKDTTKSAGVLARPALIERLANDSAAAVSWLRERTGVDLSMRSQLGGHTVKRTLRPSNAFVGAELTFAAGQVLNKMAAERPEQFRLLLRSKWTGLERAGDRWKVLVGVNGSTLSLEGTSVIIASGGFGHDSKEQESLLLKNRPDLADFPTTLGPQTTGDGVKIARDLGAKLVDMDRVQLHPTGFVDPAKPSEHTKTLAAELLRGVGGLMLDRNGDRFTDELGTRQAVVNSELKSAAAGRDLQGIPPRSFHLVLNGKAAAVADRHVTLYSKKGLLQKVEGLKGLAAQLKIEEKKLNQTFEAYNRASKDGHDEFGRTIFPAHTPIEKDETFYVGQIVPVIHYTMGGIAIDSEGRVLDEAKGEPMANLYAVGEASGGVHGDNRLAGNSLLECTVFGRHVGLNLPLRASAARVEASLPAAAESPAVTGPSPATGAAGAKEWQISYEELGKHKTKEQGLWVALYGQIYDLTDYVDEHPGGAQAVLDVAGVDGTETFSAVHNKEMLTQMGFQPLGILAAKALTI